MSIATMLSRIARDPGDPVVRASGPSSLTLPDRVSRWLGWFSLGLGATEIVAAGPIARALGIRGWEWLIRAYGVREIAAGIPTLSVDKQFGLYSRLAGDAIDVGTLVAALSRRNPKRGNVLLALLAVGGVTALDLYAAGATTARHARGQGANRDYRDRSGLPKGVAASRGIARRNFEQPRDMRTPGTVAEALRGAPKAAAR